MKKLAVIIPAAGSGTRLGSPLPKPFILIQGKSILLHTVEVFLSHPKVCQIIVVTSKDWIEKVQSQLNEQVSNSSIKIIAIEGSTERQFSIYNALSVLSREADLVAVHDAVRPFISHSDIDKCCEACLEFAGAVLGVPAKDTIKKVDKRQIINETPDRSTLWQAQTPQIFKREIFVEAYENAKKEGFVGTDDASLVERLGYSVKMIEGSRENLKITFPIDLRVAELIIKNKIDL